jgi:hypothetical protein
MPKQSTYSTFTPVLSDYVSATDDPGGTPVHGNVTLTSLRDLLQANLTKATITAGANSQAIVSTGYSLTGSNAQSLVDLSGIWNTTGTPTLIKANVTDTASNAASKLLDLQLGGTSRVAIAKNGDFTWTGVSPVFRSASTVCIDPTTYFNGVTAATSRSAASNGFVVGSGYSFSFSSTTAANGSPDLYLYRDAANTLALRNSTNQQKINTYGTYTDGSNYRRLEVTMTTAGVASITPTGAGTGAIGNVLHISGLPTSNPGPGILWNNAGTPAIGT